MTAAGGPSLDIRLCRLLSTAANGNGSASAAATFSRSLSYSHHHLRLSATRKQSQLANNYIQIPFQRKISAAAMAVSVPAASEVITAMSAISLVLLTGAGWMEIKGKNMQYSKLMRVAKEKPKVKGKVGMIIIYTPALLAGIFSLFTSPLGLGDLRFTLLRSAITTHFFKRLFEVLFVHNFSGLMEVEAMIPISMGYFLSSSAMIYTQQFLQEPLIIDLKYIGIPIFLVGIAGNFYHHYLLSKLRSESEKQYKIPQGGLFSLVICPHYLFEIIGFWGISCISQTIFSACISLGTTFYLMGRSYATRRWYQSKFEDFPKDIKALIPFIF